MKILITGGTGMVGRAFKNIKSRHHFISVGSRDYDLCSAKACRQMLFEHTPEAIIHLAAKVGGVKANTDYLGDFFRENILINTNVLDAARRAQVQKVVSLLSTCVYPDKATYPLTADQIHNGLPHYSNYAYAHAKRMLDVQSRAYRDQYGCNFITAIPNNLFGENDNFDLENSHVLPAIIRKMHEAKLIGSDVALWGDGEPLREFTYSRDIARALLLLVEGYDERDPINIGNTLEISIREVAEKIAVKIGFTGDIIWKNDMPAGQYRKPSDNSKFQQLFGMKYTGLDEALTNVCEWFIINYPNVRGAA